MFALTLNLIQSESMSQLFLQILQRKVPKLDIHTFTAISEGHLECISYLLI